MKAAEKKSGSDIDNLINMAKELANDASVSLPLIHSKELRHLPVPRSGFETQVENLFLANEEGGVDEEGVQKEKMQALLRRAERTQQLVNWLQRTLTQAEYCMRVDRADAWTIFTQQYAELCGKAVSSPAVEQAIAPIVEFLATGPQPKKAKNDDAEQPAKTTPEKPVKESNG